MCEKSQCFCANLKYNKKKKKKKNTHPQALILFAYKVVLLSFVCEFRTKILFFVFYFFCSNALHTATAASLSLTLARTLCLFSELFVSFSYDGFGVCDFESISVLGPVLKLFFFIPLSVVCFESCVFCVFLFILKF